MRATMDGNVVMEQQNGMNSGNERSVGKGRGVDRGGGRLKMSERVELKNEIYRLKSLNQMDFFPRYDTDEIMTP